MLISPKASRAEAPRQRSFTLTYAGEIQANSEHPTRVWLPFPSSNGAQQIKISQLDLPVEHQITTEAKHGNRLLYFEIAATPAKSFDFEVSYDVTRHEVQAIRSDRHSPEDMQAPDHYLAANALVPIGGLTIPKLPQLPSDQKASLQLARSIYDHVDGLVAYDKSQPGYGRGDVRWVCDSRTGNCTDFHSLFISLARENRIPAKFEIGFPLPPQRGKGSIGGYHCWASFFDADYGWVPVDISEADKHPELKEYYFGNLTENRVSFSTGRDINLVPRQAAPPLNYFVYPHVEAGGKAIDRQMIDLRFEFIDQDQ